MNERQGTAFFNYYDDLISSCGLERTDHYVQHGSTTRLAHSVAVAYYSFLLAQACRISVHYPDLIRGALLHDYFLYDATDGDPSRKGHWTRHPKIALENAEKELTLTAVERDVILKHMFPLTVRWPKYRESILVLLVDKGCSIYEFFCRKGPYVMLRTAIFQRKSQLSLLLPETAGAKA